MKRELENAVVFQPAGKRIARWGAYVAAGTGVTLLLFSAGLLLGVAMPETPNFGYVNRMFLSDVRPPPREEESLDSLSESQIEMPSLAIEVNLPPDAAPPPLDAAFTVDSAMDFSEIVPAPPVAETTQPEIPLPAPAESIETAPPEPVTPPLPEPIETAPSMSVETSPSISTPEAHAPRPVAPEMNIGDQVFGALQLETPPSLIYAPPPTYPGQTRRKGIQGTVTVVAVLDRNGHVVSVRMEPGPLVDAFGPATLDAVRKWRFSPGKVDGRPVRCEVSIPVQFTLPGTERGAQGPMRGRSGRQLSR
jgi:protein TonB